MSRFTEQIAESITGRIDKEAGIVRDIRLLGRESKRGRTYSDKALSDAEKLYEGVVVNFDHSESERKFSERFGVIRNSRKGDGEVRGDLHYLKSHPMAPAFVEAVERFSDTFGMSHDADGSQASVSGKTVVESLNKVYSLDVVGKPATNNGLFESEGNTVKTTVGKIIEAHPKHECACLLRDNIKEMDAAMADTAVEMDDGANPDAQIKAAFVSAVAAVASDESLSPQEALKKIRDILKARDTVTGGGKGDDNPAGKPDGEKPPMSESEQQLRKELDTLKEKDKRRDAELAKANARQSLIESNIDPTDTRIAAIIRCETDAERKSLIEDLPKRQRQNVADHSGLPSTSPPRYPLSEADDAGESYEKLKEAEGRALFGTAKK